MWGKILKYREKAKGFYKVMVNNGKQTSFWYESWSEMGCLIDIIGTRGFIDMGISREATVEEAMINHRRRKHREQVFNLIEEEIIKCKERVVAEDDIGLWKQKENTFKRKFSSKSTWDLFRVHGDQCAWSKGVWFHYATPKFSFLTWLAIQNRLTTGDRMLSWRGNINAACSLCDAPLETRDHLYFECRYSEEVWNNLTQGLMGGDYTNTWSNIVSMISTDHDAIKTFVLRYLFQATIHRLWLERNRRRHGEKPIPPSRMIRMVDRGMRNRFSSILKAGDRRMEGGLQFWFSTRPEI